MSSKVIGFPRSSKVVLAQTQRMRLADMTFTGGFLVGLFLGASIAMAMTLSLVMHH